jgi:hypothetical protein
VPKAVFVHGVPFVKTFDTLFVVVLPPYSTVIVPVKEQ